VLLHSSEVLETVHRLVSERQFDAVVAYGTAMARYVFEPPLRDVPCVLDMIDVDSEKWAALGKTAGAFRRPIYRREARLLRQFERRAYDRASATAVVNERELVLLNQIVGRAGGIAIPNGVDFQAFRPPSAPVDSAQVVFCGVFNYRPNEEGALWLATEVWPRVLAARPDANLVLVGAQPTKAVLGLAQAPSIQVTGTVADVRPFLLDSAVAAAPLHLARGVQNKVLEALSAGLPCVVTPPVLDGLPQGVRAGCRLASDADSFAAQLVTLLNQTPLSRRTLAHTADVSSLDWAEQLRPFLGLVHDCSPSAVKA
jgi:sugar transferase (PEP-CTERM/EpsH1 system associated)